MASHVNEYLGLGDVAERDSGLKDTFFTITERFAQWPSIGAENLGKAAPRLIIVEIAISEYMIRRVAANADVPPWSQGSLPICYSFPDLSLSGSAKSRLQKLRPLSPCSG